ncbi:MAG: aminoacyl--tRNA ligase-related protein [bacterium]|nr:aminoacyl--tRNA ligase-related protein [bacterium]
MKQSQLFAKTLKTISGDEKSINAQLLERAGFVQKVMAGVYSYLPLGQRVLIKIENIVREEMNSVGGQEVLMPSLHPKENWIATGRWTGLDVLFKIKSQHGYDYALGPSHEEIVVPMALPIISSYKDLPLAVYQIQTKFRDEPRAKSGLLRGREFRMKDLYSFHTDEADRDKYYEVVASAYTKIFKRLGLDSVFTEATGGTFSKYSDEFQVENKNGEDTIYVCESCSKGKNADVYGKGAKCKWCGKSKFRETKGSEVGNIFKLSDKYPQSFSLTYTDTEGKKKPVVMGCYGIGISRAMGVLVEKFHDEKGMVWPESVAPFQVHLIELKQGLAAKTYKSLLDAGIELLYDDRDVSVGSKFADSDLIGIPWRVVISEKTEKVGKLELKKRTEKEISLVGLKELLKTLDSGSPVAEPINRHAT